LCDKCIPIIHASDEWVERINIKTSSAPIEEKQKRNRVSIETIAQSDKKQIGEIWKLNFTRFTAIDDDRKIKFMNLPYAVIYQIGMFIRSCRELLGNSDNFH
jgi:hypothetical protein